MRPSQRETAELRAVSMVRNYTKHAEGSVLVSFGDTRVICNASVQIGFVPRFLKGEGRGWITAEYGMLPRSTGERMDREAYRGKQTGRTQEIQRLIGRSLRAMIDLEKLGEHTITVDCDVIQADGGTRTASITGACVAVADAIQTLISRSVIKTSPIKHLISAVSVGIFKGTPVLDLDYPEDSKAETDLNVVMTENGAFIEVQGTAEGKPFSDSELTQMLALAKNGCQELIQFQKQLLSS